MLEKGVKHENTVPSIGRGVRLVIHAGIYCRTSAAFRSCTVPIGTVAVSMPGAV